MKLTLATMTQENWAEYQSWWASRGLVPPGAATQGIFVQNGEGLLVGGALCYPCEGGPYVFVEHMAVHPALKPAQAHEVTTFVVRCTKSLGALTSKHPIVLTKGGASKILEREGFQTQGLTAYIGSITPGPEPSPPTTEEESAPAEGKELDEGTQGETSNVRPRRPAVKRKGSKKKGSRKASKAADVLFSDD